MAEITGTFNVGEDGSVKLPINGQEVTYIPLPKQNEDKTIDLNIGGKPVRYALESDLLAVKGGAEAKATEWETEKAKFNTSLAEANRLREEAHQALLQTQAAMEQLKEQYKDYDTHKTRVGELEAELGSHKESVSKYESELADRIRQNLIGNGATEDALKDKTLDQLRSLEEAAKIFGGNGNKGNKPANYDGGAGPGAGSTPESPLDRAKRILEEHEAKGHKIGAR